MTTRIGVVVMAALLGLYLVFAVRYGVLMIGLDGIVPVAIGIALLVLPLLAAGTIVAEVTFGVRAEKLARRLEAEGGLPDEEIPASASGRVDRTAAQAVFATYQQAVEAEPGDWRAWYRLALVYDASGDRRRARWATRTAIRLERDAR
ncbi:tetratricopeptide repeat protein [uncultured Schumannella sp.]|uniref:tetratricopeptide repeat protein n=1 Tax=uncultured Schumannella sp. TaxID=1195956 RepID=UPI0025E3A191|nr:tetratricopeptide repeat protein [uncultured Schumannella sp.]